MNPFYSQLRMQTKLSYQTAAILLFFCIYTTTSAFSTLPPIEEKISAAPEITEDSKPDCSISPAWTWMGNKILEPLCVSETDAGNQLRRFTLFADRDILSENSGETTVTVTAQLDGGQPFTTAQTIVITVRGSGTAAAVDFTPVANFNIVIAANARSGSATFNLTPEDDLVDEVNETITVASTSSLVTGTDTISLQDDDPAPAGISLDTTPDSAQEDEGALTLTVTATVDGRTTYGAAQSIPVTVQGTLADGVVDFTAVPDFSIAIAGGARSGEATFTLIPEDDLVDEADETITVRSSSSLVTNSVSFLLQDDDSAPRGINLLTSTGAVYEDLGPQQIEVSLEISGPTVYATDQMIPLSVTGSGTSGAVGFAPVADFRITLPAEATTSSSTTFTITPVDNLIHEANETITVSSSASQVTGPATINLIDDDAPGNIRLAVSPSVIGEGDGETSVTITATIGNGRIFGRSTSIPIDVAGSGSANVVGFSSVSSVPVVFPPLQSTGTATLSITPIDDEDITENEKITLSSINSAVTGSAVITLVNDDVDPVITLRAAPGSVLESAGATTITVTASVQNLVTRSADLTIPITVAGSGTADAVDFAPVPDFNLTLGAGMTAGSATFTLSPVNDSEEESNEIITISSTQEFVANSAAITLVDDDGEDPVIILSAVPGSVPENNGATVITVTASIQNLETRPTNLTIPITVTGSGNAGTVDFIPVPDFTLALPAGESTGSATFILSPVNDSQDEMDETITISSTLEFVINAPAITITDDDATPTVSLQASPNSIRENDGETDIVVTATLNGSTQFGTAQILPLRVTGSGKPAAVDFMPVADFSLTIEAGSSSGSASFVLIPENDAGDETNEVLTIESSNSLVIRNATVTITDDDDPVRVQLSVNPDAVYEERGSQEVMVTGTLVGGSVFAEERNIPLVFQGSGSLEAADFAPIPDAALKFEPGLSTATAIVNVIPIDDQEFESDETITVSSTDPLVGASVVLRLINDDAEPEGVMLRVSPDRIREDAGATKVTVSATVQGDTRYATSKEIALNIVGDEDPNTVGHLPIPGVVLTIPAGADEGTAEFEVVPENDTAQQPDATITVNSESALVAEAVEIILENDDAAPTGIALSVTPSSISESDGPTSLTITATVQGGTTFIAEQTLSISAAGTGEAAAVDFASIPDFDLTIPAKSSTSTVTIEIVPEDDILDERDETITFRTQNPLVIQGATLRITDDDAPPSGIAVSLNPGEIAEDAGKTEVTVTVRVTGTTRYATDKVLNLTGTGSGMPGVVGFTLTAPATVLLPAGQSHGVATIAVEPVNNFRYYCNSCG